MYKLRELSPPAKAVVLAAAVAILVLAISIDRLLGPQASVLLFYVLSIAAVTWIVRPELGYPWSALCALVHFWSSRQAHGFVHYWNFSIELVSFLIFTLILRGLIDQISSEQGLARTDPLTRIKNRRAFVEAATEEIERVRRYGHPFSAVYLDVDNFKLINDSFGHKAGDAILTSIANSIERNVRRADVVARIGGDEFALLLPETDAAGAQIAVNRLLLRLRQSLDAQQWPVTVSVGLVTFTEPPTSVDELLCLADEAMYVAKFEKKEVAQQ